MAVLVECNNKLCRDADGRREFVADGPEQTVTKTRYPEGRWHHDPDDHLAPPTFEEKGDPVVDTIDIYPCPRCGSPTAKSRS